MRPSPRVAILMATFNGRTWIEEQILSIFAQQGVRATLFVSDDGSTDGTLDYLRRLAAEREDVVLLPAAPPSGASAANFARLLRDAELGTFDAVALADQDDVWEPSKLLRAIEQMREFSVDGYSSNVQALFPDGRRAMVQKASPQQRYDHYFESPGPGCSFVLSKRLLLQLVPLLQAMHDRGDRHFAYHDWFIYAFARRAGFGWRIDPVSTMLYRQHAHNVLGANIGFLPRLKRLQTMRSGWYFAEVRWQHEVLESLGALMPNGACSIDRNDLRIDGVKARLRFCLRVAPHARRRLRDRLSLVVCVLSGFMR